MGLYYTKVYRCVKPGARHFFQAIQDLKRLFVKAACGLKTAQVPGT